MRFSLIPLLIFSDIISTETQRSLRERRLQDAAKRLMKEHGLTCREVEDLLDIVLCKESLKDASCCTIVGSTPALSPASAGQSGSGRANYSQGEGDPTTHSKQTAAEVNCECLDCRVRVRAPQ